MVQPTNSFRTLCRFLHVMVVVQCAGLCLSLVRDTTAVGAVLFTHLRAGELATLLVDRGGAAVALALAVVAAAGRVRRGLVFVSAWFTLIACAQAYDGGTPFSSLSLAAHATRIALPLAALASAQLAAGRGDLVLFRWGLRIAVALTFATHGLEALGEHPRFVDYLLTADRKLFSVGLDQSIALQLLLVIGAVDVALAAWMLTGRDTKPVLWYAAVWGLVTALARVVYMDVRYPAAVIRVANYAVPFALVLIRDVPALEPPLSSRIKLRALRPAVTALAIVAMGAGLYWVGSTERTQAAETTPSQLRIVWGEHPSSEAVVAWSTEVAGERHRVHFDTQPRGGDLDAYRFSTETRRDGRYDSTSSFFHHALLEGLDDSTTYYFVVVSDGEVSREYHFVTAPRDDREFKLLYGGDSRSDRTNRRRVNDLIRARTEADRDILAFAHGGDYVADGGDFGQWDGWLDDLQRTITSSGRILPLIPARGNHEASGVLYDRVFAFPGINEDNYFVSELSPQAAFIVLNTNTSVSGDQRDFLARELAARTPTTRWLLASYHRPAYPAVKSPGDALEHWVPLFEEFDVDLVCESDGHVLKRTVPMRNGQRSEDGVVYVGEGGLGVDQRTPIDASYLAMARSAHHIQMLTFRPDRLGYQAITLDGQVVDSIDRLPQREGTPTAGRLLSARAISSDEILVRFDKPVDSDTATQADRYAVSPGAQVRSVARADDAESVLLTVSAELEPGQYTLTVNDVFDVDGLRIQSNIALFVTGTEGGTITASGENLPEEGADKAFDGLLSTKWLTFEDSAWVQVDFEGDARLAINGYSLSSANDRPDRDPRDWRLLGSNDGSTWAVLDSRTDERFAGRLQTQWYEVSNPVEYAMVRLEISSNLDPEGADALQIAEIFFGVEGVEAPGGGGPFGPGGSGGGEPCEPGAGKPYAGQCGCYVPDTDSDGDGVADCIDECPADAGKTMAGPCGCDVSEAGGDAATGCGDDCEGEACGAGDGGTPPEARGSCSVGAPAAGQSAHALWLVALACSWIARRRRRISR